MGQHQLPQTMKAAVMTEPGRIIIEEQAVPKPAEDEVLIQVMAVGVRVGCALF